MAGFLEDPPQTDTRVCFAGGATEGRARVLDCLPAGTDLWDLIVDETPFHPLSHHWPDQPGDRGCVDALPLDACLTGSVHRRSGALSVHEAIEARRGDPDHVFVVVHRLRAARRPFRRGQSVRLIVDARYRHALSLAHSACHLATLNLNAVLTPFWRKDPGPRDGAGQIDFDRLAITCSRIASGGSEDRYRLGKSLRKRGFQAADAAAALAEIEARINRRLTDWLRAGGRISIDSTGPGLTDSRRWRLQRPGEPVIEVYCGGTHVDDLARYRHIRVGLDQQDQEWILRTRVDAADSC